ncbi:MAG: hypothetical protein MH204_01420, partial [Fimbriimonadaceae bacterium]|nr:hypothetical protein [Fimbriimonadaceae bacterium]
MSLARLLLLGTAGTTAAWSEFALIPRAGLPLGGYTERGEAISSFGPRPLVGRVLVLRGGARPLVMAALELLTIPESLLREVRARLPADLDLVLVATHTHHSADSQMLNDRMTFRIPGIAPYRSRELDSFADRI